jgi:hypothetical protein
VTGTHRRWLVIASLLVAAYGTALVVAGPVAARLFDTLGFGMSAGGVPAGPARSYVLFVYGVLGAVLTGWMLTLAAVASGPPGNDDGRLRRRLAAAFVVWFLLDTGMSLATGVWQHALFNLAFLTLIGAPLLLGAPAGHRTSR